MASVVALHACTWVSIETTLTQAAMYMRSLLQLLARQPWLPRLLLKPLPIGPPESADAQQLDIELAVGDCRCPYWLDNPVEQTCC